MELSSLHQLTDHVYWLSPDETTDRPILGAVVGGKGALIVDAGNSPAHARLFLGELAKITNAPPKYLALTHAHWDHVFGISEFDLPILAHTETKRIVAEMARLDWGDEALDGRVGAGLELAFCRDMIKAELPDRKNLILKAPDIGFTERIELDLGNITCQLVHVGGDHAADSTIVCIPEEKVIFLGDSVYMDIYHDPRRFTPTGVLTLIERLQSFQADSYLLAHEPEPISKAEMAEYLAILETTGKMIEGNLVDRELILKELRRKVERPLGADDLEIIDAFLVDHS